MPQRLLSGTTHLEPLRQSRIAERENVKEFEEPIGALFDRLLASGPIGQKRKAIHLKLLVNGWVVNNCDVDSVACKDCS
jgi:hypothetical protein